MANKDYQRLIKNVTSRTNPETILLEKSFTDELGQLGYKYVLEYIKRAMQGVEPAYTERTIAAGNKVKDQLIEQLGNLTFRFQGSVMTNTHIVGYSDIDLVVFANQFYSYDASGMKKIIEEAPTYVPPKYTATQITKLKTVVESDNYKGDDLADLKKIRNDSEIKLVAVYKTVDINKAKSIPVELTNPKRKVDVVTANWYHSSEYVLQDNDIYKGVQIYDKDKHAKLKADFPFLSIERINSKDKDVNGRLKKMIRFLKTVKAESGVDLKLSSFTINAICFDIPTANYITKDYIELVIVIYTQFKKIVDDASYRFNLKSVDGMEFVFRKEDQVTEDKDKLEEIKVIQNELLLIITDINDEIK